MNEPDYRGPASLVVGDRAIPVTAVLAGNLNPLDGLFHWYGRVSGVDLPRPGRTAAALTIGNESRPVRLEEVDPWGNLRVSGAGRPPYELSAES
jgi:hypothetical protein